MDVSLIYIFGQDLNEEFNSVSHNLSLLKEKVDYIVDKDINIVGKSIYYLFPYLFNTSFNFYEKEVLIHLCVSSVLCLDFCLYLDKLLDKQIEFSEDLFYSKILVYQNFIMKISSINKSNNFWDFYFKYYKEYVTSVRMERNNHFGKVSDYNWDEFRLIARGKQALSKLIPALIGCSKNDLDTIIKFENAIDLLSEASQLFDDLRDWKDDLKNKRFSWVLNKIIKENNLDIDCDESIVSEILFNKGYDTFILDKASNLCEEAILCAKTNDVWVRYVRLLSMRINTLMIDLIKLKGKDITTYNYLFRNELDVQRENALKIVLTKSLNYILNEYINGLPELRHWMINTKESTANSIEVLGGDIFQRAVMLNLLLDIKDDEYINCNL